MFLGASEADLMRMEKIQPTKIHGNNKKIMESLDYIALVSVITSGVVAISSIIFPIILNYFTDRSKWKQEKNAQEIKSINEKTLDLFCKLAFFRKYDEMYNPKEEYIDTLSSFYAWEQITWTKFNASEHSEIKQIREKLETSGYSALFNIEPEIINQILNLTNNAISRIK